MEVARQMLTADLNLKKKDLSHQVSLDTHQITLVLIILNNNCKIVRYLLLAMQL